MDRQGDQHDAVLGDRSQNRTTWPNLLLIAVVLGWVTEGEQWGRCAEEVKWQGLPTMQEAPAPDSRS